VTNTTIRVGYGTIIVEETASLWHLITFELKELTK
jgi:hypothetical protein